MMRTRQEGDTIPFMGSASSPARVTSPAPLHPPEEPPAAFDADDYPALVRAAAAGDRDAMEALLLRAQEAAYRFGVVICGQSSDAEDVMQEALIKTYRHASRIRQPEAFRGWLYRTVRNACLMRRRTRVAEPKRLLSLDETLPAAEGGRPIDPADPGRGPDDLLVNKRLRRRLATAIRELPPSYRLVVFLRDMEGLSTREAAKVIGTSEANVKQRLHRARLFLRHALEKR
jgi:RNA polymerase sigma-70 factor (ECF subfamily)